MRGLLRIILDEAGEPVCDKPAVYRAPLYTLVQFVCVAKTHCHFSISGRKDI